MGNCIRRQSSSSAVWAGDDWESVALHDENGEKERLLAGGGGGGGGSGCSFSRSSSSTGSDQLKIKITKKELEELTRVANLHGLSVERVLSHLANSTTSEDDDDDHRREMLMERQRSWRPALQSIPEVN